MERRTCLAVTKAPGPGEQLLPETASRTSCSRPHQQDVIVMGCLWCECSNCHLFSGMWQSALGLASGTNWMLSPRSAPLTGVSLGEIWPLSCSFRLKDKDKFPCLPVGYREDWARYTGKQIWRVWHQSTCSTHVYNTCYDHRHHHYYS